MKLVKHTVLVAFVSCLVLVADTSAQQQAGGLTQLGGSFDCSRTGAGQIIPTLVCQTPELKIADLRQIQAYYALRYAKPERREELRTQFTARIQALVRECSTEQVLASGSQPACVARALNDLRSFWFQELQQTRNSAALEEIQLPVGEFLKAQQSLKLAGFLPANSVVDGVYGTGTREALTRFQLERGIAGGGFLTGATLSAVSLTSAAAPAAVQTRLPPCPSDQSILWHMCQGTYTFANGDRYEGEWRDNKSHGRGTYTFADGDRFVGEFRDDKSHGQGTFTFANGDRFVGEYRDGKRNGQGTFTFANGDRYVGELRDDKSHGQGTFTFANGNRYVGEFRDDKFHGQGTFTFANGNRYVGEFRDDKRNGQGTFTFANGNRYVGEFRDNKRDGQGTLTFANGDRFVGEYRDDKMHGQGTLTFANGNRYVGEFRDNKRDGQGSLFGPDQQLLRNGIWRDDILIQANQLPTPSYSGTNVRLIRDAGTFKVPVRINGVLELQFTVDSGASDVTIPADVVMTLIRTGTIGDDDFVGEQTYRLADGSTVKSRTFRIRHLQVGSRTIENVLGSVANVEGSLLLGQSFLSRFRRVSFDYAQAVLVLE